MQYNCKDNSISFNNTRNFFLYKQPAVPPATAGVAPTAGTATPPLQKTPSLEGYVPVKNQFILTNIKMFIVKILVFGDG